MQATLEQVDALKARLDAWETLLDDLEARPRSTQDEARELSMSRRILENYRRTLARDLKRGLARVPAGELSRALSTAEASVARLEARRTDPSPN